MTTSVEVIQILSAAGIGGIIGSLVTTTVQAWFAQKASAGTRSFQERKEAYIGFLEALHRSEVEGSAEASLRAGHWQNRCELVAPAPVRTLIADIFRTNPVHGNPHPERPAVISALKAAMRADLGISPS